MNFGGLFSPVGIGSGFEEVFFDSFYEGATVFGDSFSGNGVVTSKVSEVAVVGIGIES